jgi:hypothetical protein
MRTIYLFLGIVLFSLLSCSENVLLTESIVQKDLETSTTEEFMPYVNGDIIGYNIGNEEYLLCKKNEILIFEADIMIDEKQLNTSQLRSTGRTLISTRWPNNIVYYSFHDNFSFTTIAEAAMAHWEQYTPIIFVPRTTQSNFVEFKNGDGCSSYVGMIGGQQSIIFSNGYTTGNMIHEIGHTIGFWHEHSRADRNNFVTVHSSNIQSGQAHNFKTYIESGFDGADLGSFDFNSVMLYGSYSFSSNGLPTLTKKNGTTFYGQRTGLSTTDIQGATSMYPKWFVYGNTDGTPSVGDFDGDGIFDLSVKFNDGTWLIDFASNGLGDWDDFVQGYGGNTAHPVPADYDGDGKYDLSVKKDDGSWYIDYASNGFLGWDWIGQSFGGNTAHAVPADYDGDGKADLSIKKDDGQWFINFASNGFGGGWDWIGQSYGGNTAHAVPADYDGDGKADLSIKKDDGQWFINFASNGFGGGWDWIGQSYGGNTAHPLPADYDGDGADDLAVKSDQNRKWYIDYSCNGYGSWDN